MSQHNDEALLLSAHQQIIQAHLHNDVQLWLAGEADDFVVASRGEIMQPSKAERAEGRQLYLAQTKFTEYRDLIPPLVKVSADGTLGWVMAQLKVVGERMLADGQTMPIEAVWAWIELYQKQDDGRWRCIGNVSNQKP